MRRHAVKQEAKGLVQVRRSRSAGSRVLLLAALVTISACSPAGDSTEDTTAASGANDTAAAAGGGDQTLVISLASDPQHLNNGLTTDITTILTSNQVYEPLMTMDLEGEMQPHLAESWDLSEDNLHLDVALRDDVQWHDGEPFTAEDVAFSYLELNGQYNGQGTAAYSVIESIDVQDDHNLTINFKNVSPYFVPWSLVQTTYGLIYPEHIFSEGDPVENPANDNPVGTGPFVFEEWERGSHIEFSRNDNYWQDDRPIPDRLVFQIIPSEEGRLNALTTGAIDYIPYQDFPLASFEELDGNPDTEVVDRPRPQAGMNLLFFNTREEPLDQVEVRQAISHAINRDAIVANATDGLMSPGVALIGTQDQFFTEPSNLYPYDPELANQMLDDAGLEAEADGTRFSLRLSYDQAIFAGSLEASAQIMRENLHEVGIELELEPMDNATWSETAGSQWDFDLTMGSFGVGPDPETGLARLVETEAIEPRLGRNMSGYSNPELDEMMEAAGVEGDEEARTDLYAEAQEIMSRDVPMLPMWENAYYVAFRSGIEGLPQGIFMQESFQHVSLP